VQCRSAGPSLCSTPENTQEHEHPSSASPGPTGVGRSLHKCPPGRSKTGHLADASALDTSYSSARGRRQIPFPIGFAPGLPNYWPRCFPHRIWRGLYSVSRSYGAGDRQALDLVSRLVSVFGRALTQENGPRRRRGKQASGRAFFISCVRPSVWVCADYFALTAFYEVGHIATCS
jgi:hypothetical protein